MRKPASLRVPRAVAPGWLLVVLTGTVLMLVLLFFALIFPWHEIGLIVSNQELPRVRRDGRTYLVASETNSIAVDAHGDAWVLGEPPTRIEHAAVEGEMQRRRQASQPLILRLHRQVRWGVLRSMLRPAARVGGGSVYLTVRTT